MPAVPSRLAATVLGTTRPRQLAEFYALLLGWEIRHIDPDWVTVRPIEGGAGLSFQLEPHFSAPIWPYPTSSEQQMHSHLDIEVTDLSSAVEWAEELGARQSDHQPQAHVRVMIDPSGHYFCLFE